MMRVAVKSAVMPSVEVTRAQADDIFVSPAIAYHADGPSPSAVIDDTKLHFSREILTAKVSTQFCRDSNQCLLPRL